MIEALDDRVRPKERQRVEFKVGPHDLDIITCYMKEGKLNIEGFRAITIEPSASNNITVKLR